MSKTTKTRTTKRDLGELLRITGSEMRFMLKRNGTQVGEFANFMEVTPRTIFNISQSWAFIPVKYAEGLMMMIGKSYEVVFEDMVKELRNPRLEEQRKAQERKEQKQRLKEGLDMDARPMKGKAEQQPEGELA